MKKTKNSTVKLSNIVYFPKIDMRRPQAFFLMNSFSILMNSTRDTSFSDISISVYHMRLKRLSPTLQAKFDKLLNDEMQKLAERYHDSPEGNLYALESLKNDMQYHLYWRVYEASSGLHARIQNSFEHGQDDQVEHQEGRFRLLGTLEQNGNIGNSKPSLPKNSNKANDNKSAISSQKANRTPVIKMLRLPVSALNDAKRKYQAYKPTISSKTSKGAMRRNKK